MEQRLNRTLMLSTIRTVMGLRIIGAQQSDALSELLQGAFSPNVTRLAFSLRDCSLSDSMLSVIASRLPVAFPNVTYLEVDIIHNPSVTGDGLTMLSHHLMWYRTALTLRLFLPLADFHTGCSVTVSVTEYPADVPWIGMPRC